jgi:hypothetical protein
MSTSLLQLTLLLVAIGVLLLSICIVRSSPKGDLRRPAKFLHWGFWGCVLSFALAMGVDRLFAGTDAEQLVPRAAVVNLFMAAFYVAACFYWTSLAVLADRIGRSWITWVVAGLATLAVGFIGSYFLMASRVRIELAQRRGTATSPAVG